MTALKLWFEKDEQISSKFIRDVWAGLFGSLVFDRDLNKIAWEAWRLTSWFGCVEELTGFVLLNTVATDKRCGFLASDGSE